MPAGASPEASGHLGELARDRAARLISLLLNRWAGYWLLTDATHGTTSRITLSKASFSEATMTVALL